ncbi:MAG: metallophosphoesterase [Actinomycetota bacterium]|nr:metallophosphoesterase [Actinomycetota bacterium]
MQRMLLLRSRPLRTTVTALLLLALGGVGGTSYAAGPTAHSSQASELAGRTTVEQRVGGGDPAAAFSFLSPRAGESHLLREEGVGQAVGGRTERRRSLLYFSQLSDFQLADEESPARVEFVDATQSSSITDVFSAAQRPQEALVAHAAEASIRQVNRFLTSPVPGAGGTRASMAFSLFTGDLADSQQLNETRAVLALLDGGPVNPNSGVTNQGCLPGTPGADEAARYTGVQDKDDFLEGPQFYDPDSPSGPYAGWPRWPGLMDRAQAAFPAGGLRVPSYLAFGNHDALVQGNGAALAPYELVGTGCLKPTLPAFNPLAPQSALDPGYLTGLLQTEPGRVALVPRDPDRRYLDHRQFKELFRPGQADAHGFGYVDPAENLAGAGHVGYYAWSPKPGFRFISLDTVSEGGIPGVSTEGNVDDAQWRWLERQLAAAERADQLTIVFGHHPIRSLNSRAPDELAGPCLGSDPHGHGSNPGCDRDPRNSQPIRRGEELRDLLLAHPHVIATVFGHTHENRITPFRRAGGGGFWAIESPSHIDWPLQSRLLEVMDNDDGTLSIFGTVLDVDAPVRAPTSGSPAGGFDVPQLASVARTLAYNDPQAGGLASGNGKGDGTRADRNVELLIGDPRRSSGTGGRCAVARGRLSGKSVGLARLGRRRAANRRAFPRSSLSRPRSTIDRFCLVGRRAIRVGYPSRRFQSRMSRGERRRTAGRAVLALSSHPAYAVKRVRNGTSLRRMRRRLRGERRFKVGRNSWYLMRAKQARIVFKVSGSRVREVGLADLGLTSTPRKARRFLRSFS